MNLQDLKLRLDNLASEAVEEFQSIEREADLVQVKNRFLGRKGAVKALGSEVRNLPAEDRPLVGREINATRTRIEEGFQTCMTQLRAVAREKRLAAGRVDLTLPSRSLPQSGGHPLIQVEQELIGIFRSMGFDVATGPQLEDDLHNFEKLNFPPDHPARDMQDTFLISPIDGRDDLLLRTHTSPVQVRTMLRYGSPIQIIAPGVVYRHDHDATHSPVFRQIECLHIGKGITMSHLKGTLLHFVQAIFGADTKIRLRPSYFPFTEPSAEVDVSSDISKTGWLEVLGAGMVDPNVLRACGHDPDEVSGYAFGVGVERIAMIKLGIPDIRSFYQNDVRFLEQF